ncbi:MAG: transposase [Spirochaetota bacterium]
MTCPSGQEAVVQAGRKAQRYTCAFDDAVCRGCPLRDQCPTKKLKRKPLRILRFSLVDLRIAKQRHDVATSGKGKNIRAAVESTVRSVIHPFGGHLCKLPVRGMMRVTHMIILSAAMVNVRRIASYVASTLEICLNT